MKMIIYASHPRYRTDVKVKHFINHQKIHRVVDYKDPILNDEKNYINKAFLFQMFYKIRRRGLFCIPFSQTRWCDTQGTFNLILNCTKYFAYLARKAAKHIYKV